MKTGILGIIICIICNVIVFTQIAMGQTDSLSVAPAITHGNDFLDSVFGVEFTLGQFWGLFFFGFLGAATLLGFQSAKGAKKINNGTPTKWSEVFVLVDNWKRLLLGFVIMFAFVRFYVWVLLLLKYFLPDTYALVHSFPKELIAYGFGLSSDLIAKWAKKKYAILQVRREPRSV